KMGQLASTRTDLLPPALIHALESLQDNVPPFPFEEVAEALEKAWGQKASDILEEIDPVPLAAASIGQVHRARLKDGRAVVVKVRRPGIVALSNADFDIVLQLARMAEKRTEWGKQYRIAQMAQDLVVMLRDEMDFNVEANNTALARKNCEKNQQMVIPEPIWDLVHSNVLVLQEVMGVKVTDRMAIERQGLDPHVVATHFVEAMYEQVFVHGFFHADPHPGNVHVDDHGRLQFLDWGLVGVFTPHMRARSVQLVLGLTRGNSQEVLDALLTLGVVPMRIDRDAVLRDVDRLRRRYYDTSLKDFNIGQALTDIFLLAQRYHIGIPVEYTMLAKAAVLSDGVVRLLDPGISLVEVGKPFA
ncbi:MAG: AarF/UbiB family protein, partial [Firmicutes bacterium]|nr:AarF/UbiB family protein [Bacillota bacterium]